MAHWIIEETGLTEKEDIFRCSECGKEYTCGEIATMDFGGPRDPIRCPNCKAVISGNPKIISGEEINRRRFVKCCDTLLNVFENTLANDCGFVLMSRFDYDEIQDRCEEYRLKFEDADRAKNKCLDILDTVGLNEETVRQIAPGSGRMIHAENNPATLRKRVIFEFEVENNRRI